MSTTKGFLQKEWHAQLKHCEGNIGSHDVKAGALFRERRSSQNGRDHICDWESLWRAERVPRQVADGGRAEPVSDERADKSL